MNRYVVGFAYDHKEELVALMLKARPDWQKGRLNGIGGHIEADEQPIDAMEREWDEETSESSPNWTLFAYLTGENFQVYFYRANTDIVGLESGSDGEEIVICEPEKLPDNVVPNLRWLIPMSRVSCFHEWPYYINERFEVPYDNSAAPPPPAQEGE